MIRAAFLVMCLWCGAVVVDATPDEHLRWRDASRQPITTPLVVQAHGLDSAHPYVVGLNEILVVHVLHLASYMRQLGANAELCLVLNNQRFDGIKASNIDTNSNDVTFRLSLDNFSGVNQQQWAEVLGRPNPWSTMPVSVSIAPSSGGFPISTVVSKVDRIENGVIVPSSVRNGYSIQIAVIRIERFYVATFFILLGIVVFVRLARHSTMLRAAAPEGGDGAYSLSLTQMAFWFILVVVSSIYLWVITSLYVPISSSVLGIIGISTASTLAASGIDLSKRKTAQRQGESATFRATRSMWKDITNDGSGGLSLQRVQVVVWTGLFGLYYCYRVWSTMSIPDIDNSMLVLMGLTSAAYVGGKLPEKS